MVKLKLIFSLTTLVFLFNCPAGPPSGPDTDISKKLTANCLISPFEDTLKIFITKWSELSENDDDFIYSVNNPYYDYWSVSGAEVRVAVDGKYLPVEEDSVTDYSEFYEIYHYFYYRFPNVDVHSGQRWELTITHPDYDSLYAETIVPDSVKFIELPTDTVRHASGILKFAWTQANGAEGYLPRLMFVAENDNGENVQQEIYTVWNSSDRSGTINYPQKSLSIQYSASSMFEEIKSLNSGDYPIFGDFNQYDLIYLQFYVYSLNEALYNIQRWMIQPDELSGFNVPIRIFTNVNNGSGILGAFWRTASKKIIVDREFLINQCQ